MSKPILSVDVVRWKVETSHMVAVPEYFEAESLSELRGKLQRLADSSTRAIGELSFRYEVDSHDDSVFVIHSHFIGKDGNRRRFMRLRRVD